MILHCVLQHRPPSCYMTRPRCIPPLRARECSCGSPCKESRSLGYVNIAFLCMSKLGERHTRRAEGVGHVIVLVGSSVLRVKWTAYGIRPAHLHVGGCGARCGEGEGEEVEKVRHVGWLLVGFVLYELGDGSDGVIHDGCSCVCVMVN